MAAGVSTMIPRSQSGVTYFALGGRCRFAGSDCISNRELMDSLCVRLYRQAWPFCTEPGRQEPFGRCGMLPLVPMHVGMRSGRERFWTRSVLLPMCRLVLLF